MAGTPQETSSGAPAIPVGESGRWIAKLGCTMKPSDGGGAMSDGPGTQENAPWAVPVQVPFAASCVWLPVLQVQPCAWPKRISESFTAPERLTCQSSSIAAAGRAGPSARSDGRMAQRARLRLRALAAGRCRGAGSAVAVR
ncbi:MAG: hypothetical protein RIB84_17355 [Sneathiellaceae bacterium]